MFGQAAQDLKTRDLTIVQRAVPAHMLCLMVEQCTKNGFELRPDVLYKLNLAAAAPMAGCDMLSVARLARRVDEVATTLLHDLSPDDARHGLYCCAMFVLTLVEEGRMADKTNQAVLISLLLLDDVADERKDSKGPLGPGRSFGFTGCHFHVNFGIPEFRQLIVIGSGHRESVPTRPRRPGSRWRFLSTRPTPRHEATRSLRPRRGPRRVVRPPRQARPHREQAHSADRHGSP